MAVTARDIVNPLRLRLVFAVCPVHVSAYNITRRRDLVLVSFIHASRVDRCGMCESQSISVPKHGADLRP
jgi:hypothetical protein